MRVLVTGADGFIGSAVVRCALRRGHRVRCAVLPGSARRNLRGLDVELAEADVRDGGAVDKLCKGVDWVFHLAAEYKIWTRDPEQLYQVNIKGTDNVLRAAHRHGAERVVHTSSIAAIGQVEGGWADESVPFNYWDRADHYMRSKWLAERRAMAAARAGVPVVIVNPSFPIGARDVGPTPTGRGLVELLHGRLPVYLRGGINVINVDDCGEGHLLAAEKGTVGERYILGGDNFTNEEFVRSAALIAGVRVPGSALPTRLGLSVAWLWERFADGTGRQPPYTVKAIRYATRYAYFDSAKAKRELGLPSTPLAESISQAVAWFRDNGYAP